MSDPTSAGPSAPSQPVRPRPPTESVRKPSRPENDLHARLLTAAILVPVVSYVVTAGGLWLLGAVMTLVLLGQREFYRLIEDKGAHPLVGFGLSAGAALTCEPLAFSDLIHQAVAFLGRTGDPRKARCPLPFRDVAAHQIWHRKPSSA